MATVHGALPVTALKSAGRRSLCALRSGAFPSAEGQLRLGSCGRPGPHSCTWRVSECTPVCAMQHLAHSRHTGSGERHSLPCTCHCPSAPTEGPYWGTGNSPHKLECHWEQGSLQGHWLILSFSYFTGVMDSPGCSYQSWALGGTTI